jgi:hypothetical protein
MLTYCRNKQIIIKLCSGGSEQYYLVAFITVTSTRTLAFLNLTYRMQTSHCTESEISSPHILLTDFCESEFCYTRSEFSLIGIMQSIQYLSSYKNVHSYDNIISLHKFLKNNNILVSGIINYIRNNH